jgi:type II secretory pathway pseudopilin PulG
MGKIRINHTGFTIIEIFIVLLIISVLLGITVATFPKQLELRQLKAADREMDKILDKVVGFAQTNGRLPCPMPASSAIASGGGDSACGKVSGFVPWDTLDIQGQLNDDSLLVDPWGNPYRYYVPSLDANADGNADFTFNGQIKEIGLGDAWDVASDPDNPVPGSDGIRDLDGQFVICDSAATVFDICDSAANQVFGNAPTTKGPYQGAVIVLLSLGKNGAELPDWVTNPDEYENSGTVLNEGKYYTKNSLIPLGTRRTTFVKRPSGHGDDFDDIIKWIAPSTLFSKMIEAGQLP